MSERIKMKDLAEQAGVSVATVSRVLKNQPGASAKTRSKVLSLKRKLNYSPSVSAQELAYWRRGQDRDIGVVRVFTRHMRDYGRGFYVDINNGLHLLNDFGYEIIQTQFVRDDLEVCSAHMLHDSIRIDGVVFVGTAPRNAVEHYLERDVPVVLADLESEDPRVPWVVADSTIGLHQLMCYLLDNGHRNIAYVHGALPTYASRERFNTFRCSLLDAQCDYRPEWVFHVACSVEGAEQDWLRLFGAHPQFDFSAVVCENDIIALGLMRACRRTGVSVPEQLSIAGIDDTNACQYAPIPLTTVHIPAFEIGQNTAKLLCSLMRRMPTPQGKFSVSTWMIERESCRKLLKSDEFFNHSPILIKE